MANLIAFYVLPGFLTTSPKLHIRTSRTIVDNLIQFSEIDSSAWCFYTTFRLNFYQLYPNPPCCNVLAIYNVGSFFTENWIRGTSHPGLEVTIFPEYSFDQRTITAIQISSKSIYLLTSQLADSQRGPGSPKGLHSLNKCSRR